MRAKRKHPNSANRKSKLQRHSKKSRRHQAQRAGGFSSSEADREALPSTSASVESAPKPAESAPRSASVESAPKPAESAPRSASVELEVTLLESKFFEHEEAVAVADVVAEDETASVWLSPEGLLRRSKYRRHVARLMTGLSMFTVVTLVMRIASGM